MAAPRSNVGRRLVGAWASMRKMLRGTGTARKTLCTSSEAVSTSTGRILGMDVLRGLWISSGASSRAGQPSCPPGWENLARVVEGSEARDLSCPEVYVEVFGLVELPRRRLDVDKPDGRCPVAADVGGFDRR